MRHVTLAARRAQHYLRRPPDPPWVRTLVCIGAALFGLAVAFSSTSWIMAGGVRNAWDGVNWQLVAWSGQAGLVVRDVFVEGRRRTPPEALRTQLGIELGMPLLALDTAATKERLEQLGVLVVGSTPEQLAAFLKAEMDKWAPVIKEAGISIRE